MSVTEHRMNRAKECGTRIFTVSQLVGEKAPPVGEYSAAPQWLSLVVRSSSGAFENGGRSGKRIHQGKRRVEDTLVGSTSG
jgi:hypothetical protein